MKNTVCWLWWYTPLIATLRRHRQLDLCELEVSQDYEKTPSRRKEGWREEEGGREGERKELLFHFKNGYNVNYWLHLDSIKFVD